LTAPAGCGAIEADGVAAVHSPFFRAAPFIPWLRDYRGRHLRADVIAGLTVAVVAVPQSMAYALIAGLPVQYGLYASIVPTIVGSLWSSSAHIVVGPTTSVSLVVFASLSELAQPGSQNFVGLALVCALAVGLIQGAMGVARLGMLLNYVSHSVILGFSAGAAVLIGVTQLPAFLGISVSPARGLLINLAEILSQLHHSHGITLGLGLVTLGIVLAMKKRRPHWPGPLVAMVATCALVGFLDLDARGVAVVGSIRRGLPPLSLPDVGGLGDLAELMPGALAIAILGLTERVSSAKLIASQTHQRLDLNQELISQGMANLASAFSSGYPVGGSFTRSAVNFRAGGKTPMSGVISGSWVALTLLLAAPLAAKLPVATLAGILMVVCVEMIRVGEIGRTVRATRNDAAVLLITFLSTLFLSIEFAVYVGVLLSIGLHLASTSHPGWFPPCRI
jgi:SulP family sulfate permease